MATTTAVGTIQGNATLRAIISHANRHTPERIADTIDTLELHGNTDEPIEESAVGNYIADRLLAAGLAPAIYVINTGTTVLAVATRTGAIIATGDITGTTLQEVHHLIEEGADGFAHLDHDPAEPDGPYEGDPETVTVTAAADHDPEFFDCITTLTRLN